MDRRHFIAVTGTLIALVPGFGLARQGSQTSVNSASCSGQLAQAASPHARLESLIRVHFGDGFRLLSWTRSNTSTLAKVGHLGNIFLVRSENPDDWTVISSSPI